MTKGTVVGGRATERAVRCLPPDAQVECRAVQDGAGDASLAAIRPGCERGRQNVGGCQHDGHVFAQPRGRGTGHAHPAEMPRVVDYLRQEPADLFEPEQLQHKPVIPAAFEAAVARDGGRGIRRALARTAEIEPVLGLEDGGRPLHHLRPVPQQPRELGALPPGLERTAGDLVHRAGRTFPTPRLDDRPRSLVQPKHGGSDRIAVLVDEPRPVRLPRDRERDRAAGEVGDLVGEQAQCPKRRVPGLGRVMLDGAITLAEARAVPDRSACELAPSPVEGRGRGREGPAVERDQHVARVRHQ
jgi:hypothetical protein